MLARASYNSVCIILVISSTKSCIQILNVMGYSMADHRPYGSALESSSLDLTEVKLLLGTPVIGSHLWLANFREGNFNAHSQMHTPPPSEYYSNFSNHTCMPNSVRLLHLIHIHYYTHRHVVYTIWQILAHENDDSRA